MANQSFERSTPIEQKLPQHQVPPEPRTVVNKPTAIKLDAWQVPTSDSDSLSDDLAQLKQADPGQRSLTVGRLALAVLKPY